MASSDIGTKIDHKPLVGHPGIDPPILNVGMRNSFTSRALRPCMPSTIQRKLARLLEECTNLFASLGSSGS